MKIDDVLKPLPGRDEILVKVHAVSVNPIDYKIRSGEFKPEGLVLPATLGRDVSGIVKDVGADVSGVRVGDEVYALLDRDHGGYAELAVAKGSGLSRKPANLDHNYAAAVPLAATTAWQGLFDHGELKPRERVLIHGAAGGVGLFAVQFAKNCGAYVIATAAGDDRELLEKLGAHDVIDYKAERFETEIRDVDLVLDLVGGETQRRSWAVLKKGGRMVSTVGLPPQEEAAKRGVVARAFFAQPNAAQLREFARMIEAGEISVVVQRTYPLDDVRRAHEHMESGHVVGKVVLTVTK